MYPYNVDSQWKDDDPESTTWAQAPFNRPGDFREGFDRPPGDPDGFTPSRGRPPGDYGNPSRPGERDGFPPGHGRPPDDHGGPGRPGEHDGFPPGHGRPPGDHGGPGRPGERDSFPPGHGRPPGERDGFRPERPGFNGSAPPGPPPTALPREMPAVRAIDPFAMRGCLYQYTYLWLSNGQSFWMYPTFVGRRSVSGYRYGRFGWVYTGFDLDMIKSFYCAPF